jgi:iron complex transport system substrate-binding protein
MLDLREKGMHHMQSPGLRRSRAAVPAIILAVFLAGCATSASSPSAAPTAAPSSSSAAPTAAPTATAPAFPATVTDDEGTAVTIPAEPKKIVSLTPAATEILFAIGAGPRVVAKVEDVANFPPEAASLPIVATFKGVEVEKIVAAGADLVISGGVNFGQGDADDQLRHAKIPVVVVEPTTTSGVVNDIRVIGQASGEAGNATLLADTMATGFDAIRTATAGIAHPTVFYETGNEPAIYGIADGSVYAELITLAGGTPVTTGSTTNYEMPTEKLVAADPDMILLGDAAYGVTPDQVKKRPGWATLEAVSSGAIYPVDDLVITRPGPRMLLGLVELVAAIHPELALPAGLPTPVPSLTASPSP